MRIGVLGAGQLGRMLALAGLPLGNTFRFYDPSPETCAGDTGEVVTGTYDDAEKLSAFCQGLDVLTFEFENVPAATLQMLSEQVTVRPSIQALHISQDRVTEKTFFAQSGVPSGQWLAVSSLPELDAAQQQFTNCIIKTRRFGYDGKGQHRVGSPQDASAAWHALGTPHLIAEQLVPFTRELSIVGVRDVHGNVQFWPLVQNIHTSGILHKSTAPAPNISTATQQHAETMLRTLMEKLEYVGVLTLELFDVNGTLLANEMAPRVHNSGHWTIEGAETSQFENHIRAITGMPLGSTTLRAPSVMLNCIGAMPPAEKVLQQPGAHLHNYGKLPRTGRKVGHVTLTGSSTVAAASPTVRADELETLVLSTRDA